MWEHNPAEFAAQHKAVTARKPVNRDFETLADGAKK